MKVKHSFRKTCILHTGNSCTHTPKFLSTNTFEFPTLSNEQLPEKFKIPQREGEEQGRLPSGSPGFCFHTLSPACFPCSVPKAGHQMLGSHLPRFCARLKGTQVRMWRRVLRRMRKSEKQATGPEAAGQAEPQGFSRGVHRLLGLLRH